MASPLPMPFISGFTSLSFKPHPISDSNSRLQGFVGINISDSPSIPCKASVPESLMPSSVREEILKKSGVVKVISLERSTTLAGVILHFFKNNVFKFLSWGSFSISPAMPSAMFNEKSRTDKEQLWTTNHTVKKQQDYIVTCVVNCNLLEGRSAPVSLPV